MQMICIANLKMSSSKLFQFIAILTYLSLNGFSAISAIPPSTNIHDMNSIATHARGRFMVTRPREGSLRLVGGEVPNEGNIEIYHIGLYGSVCDDEWDLFDAHVACRQLGFPLGASEATRDSTYGPAKEPIWMDNTNCRGDEQALSDCIFDGWHIHDCTRGEAAGVLCRMGENDTIPHHSYSFPELSRSRAERQRTFQTTSSSNSSIAGNNEIDRLSTLLSPNLPASFRFRERSSRQRMRAANRTHYVHYRIPPPLLRHTPSSPMRIYGGDDVSGNNINNHNHTSASRLLFPTDDGEFSMTGMIRMARGGIVEVALSAHTPAHERNVIDAFPSYAADVLWSPICADGWSLLEASVVCRQLGLGYAFAVTSLPLVRYRPNHSNRRNQTIHVSGVECEGNERRLSECKSISLSNHESHCPRGPDTSPPVVSVTCRRRMADLIPDVGELARSARIEDQLLANLQCAMEENCLARSAYDIQTMDPNWMLARRRLLRFTTRVINMGTDDFRPFLNKENWQWHACHRHYHSMEAFAHFDILDLRSSQRVAEGHKASFCLEDNECSYRTGGTAGRRRYSCANYGDQGISVGCADTYRYNIDCQWIDVTDLSPGYYYLKVSVNAEYKVGEMNFHNNGALCNLYYSSASAKVYNCTLTKP